MTPSLLMRVASLVVRARRGPLQSPEALRAEHARRVYPAPAPITGSLRKRADARTEQVLGHSVVTVTPKTGGTDWHVIYTHGGSFVNALVGPHWDIVEQLVATTGATVTVPLYPLAPEHDHTKALPFLEQVYRSVLERGRADRVVLCGDSAGGNLALVQALHYREHQVALPAHVILFAPWVDLTMSNPDVPAVQPRDPMLHVPHLVEMGRWWAGDRDPRDPLVSPLFADLSGLPPIHIYQGTEDVLAPDARLLQGRIAAAGGEVHMHETHGFHVFMGATITREARNVFRDLAQRLVTR